MTTYFVYSRFVGRTDSGSIRGVFTDLDSATRLALYLNAHVLDNNSIARVTSERSPLDTTYNQRLTLYA